MTKENLHKEKEVKFLTLVDQFSATTLHIITEKIKQGKKGGSFVLPGHDKTIVWNINIEKIGEEEILLSKKLGRKA